MRKACEEDEVSDLGIARVLLTHSKSVSCQTVVAEFFNFLLATMNNNWDRKRICGKSV